MPADVTPGEYLLAQPARTDVISEKSDADAATRAGQVLSATYTRPYIAHATMGPSCAIADVRADEATVWTASQGTHGNRNTFATFLGLPREKVLLVNLSGRGDKDMNTVAERTGLKF